MNYKILNKIDEQGRYNGVIFYECTTSGQYDTHGMSYLKARQTLQELGDVMGLDKIMLEVQGGKRN